MPEIEIQCVLKMEALKVIKLCELTFLIRCVSVALNCLGGALGDWYRCGTESLSVMDFWILGPFC